MLPPLSIHSVFEHKSIDRERNFKRTRVSLHPFTDDPAIKSLSGHYCHLVGQVEDCLFPVGGGRTGACAEHYRLLQIKEGVEVPDDGSQLAVPGDDEREIRGELSVLDGAGVDVETVDGGGVGGDGGGRYDLHVGLIEDGIPHAAHFVAVNVVPKSNQTKT